MSVSLAKVVDFMATLLKDPIHISQHHIPSLANHLRIWHQKLSYIFLEIHGKVYDNLYQEKHYPVLQITTQGQWWGGGAFFYG